MADDPMNVDQNAHGEGNDNQNVEEGAINRPLVQLPRFRVVRQHDFMNRVIAHRVPIDGIDGGDPVPVLDKYLRWYEAIDAYDLLSVDEADGANYLLRTLTEEEWQRASPGQNIADFVTVFATGPDIVEYRLHLRHGVHEGAPAPCYDLIHEWGRVVMNYELLEGDYVEGDGYRDVENDQLRLELRFIRDGDYMNQNVQEENQEEGEGEEEGEGGGSAAAAA